MVGWSQGCKRNRILFIDLSLDIKEIKPVNPKRNKPWIFTGRTDVEAETPILWPPDVKCWLIGKTLMLGKIEGGRRRAHRGWDVSMTSLTQWTWVWVNSRSWWWTGRPGVLQSMGLQSRTWLRDWTELTSANTGKLRCEMSLTTFLPLYSTSFGFLHSCSRLPRWC